MKTTRSRTLLAAPLLIALASLAACGADAGSDDTADTSTSTSTQDPTAESTPESGDSAGALALTADGSAAAKCAMPAAETLATFETAFSGTVTSVTDGTATLEVDQWFAGDGPSTVTVESPSNDLQDLLMAVDFQEGRTYLVSAADDRVSLCGYTAEETPELKAMYAEAFPQ